MGGKEGRREQGGSQSCYERCSGGSMYDKNTKNNDAKLMDRYDATPVHGYYTFGLNLKGGLR